MKYIRGIAIIFSVTCLAEWLKYNMPFHISASIYGIILMFLLLSVKVIRVEDVQKVADFFTDSISLMFVPMTVGLIEEWDILREMLIPFCVIIFLSTMLVMVVTGKTAEIFMARRRGKTE